MKRITLADIGLVGVAVVVGLLVVMAFDHSDPPRSASTDRVAPAQSAPSGDPDIEDVVVFGDSYAAGTGASGPSAAWVSRLGTAQGWTIDNLARGGTGFFTALTQGAEEACGESRCPAFEEMIEEGDSTADLVIVSGGRNDTDVPTAQERKSVAGFFESLRAAYPAAEIVALQPLWDASTPPVSLNTIGDFVKQSVEAVDGRFVALDQPLASREDLVADDGTHPNDAGHEVIFEAVRAALKARGVT